MHDGHWSRYQCTEHIGDDGRIWNKEIKKILEFVDLWILHNIWVVFEQGFILSESNDFIDIEI